MVQGHAASPELRKRAATKGCTVYQVLNQVLQELAGGGGGGGSGGAGGGAGAGAAMAEVCAPSVARSRLTKALHVVPDYHGNRAPLADPSMRGSVVGLSLDGSLEALAV